MGKILRRKLQVIRLSYLMLLVLLSLFSAAIRTSVGTEVHDVAITYMDVHLPVLPVYMGGTFIHVDVENLGTVNETFDVTVYAKNNRTFTIGPYTIKNSAPWASDYSTFDWLLPTLHIYAVFPPPWPWPPHRPLAENFTVWAEAEVVPGDVNVSNNVYVYGNVTVIWWILDVNPPDGHIDIRDIATVAKSFGSYPEHPNWNPSVDFNNDEKIDIRDIAVTAKHFGRSYL